MTKARQGRFHLGELKSVADYLARARRAEIQGAHKEERLFLEHALALSSNDMSVRRVLAKRHLTKAFSEARIERQ